MKTYLNRKERENYCFVAALAGTLDEILQTWKGTKEEHKYLKMGQTWVYKWMDAVMARIGVDLAEQLKRDIKSSQILMLPNEQAKIKWREAEKEEKEGSVIVNKETLLNLAEHALIGCENCNRKDYQNCDLRQVFVSLNIEPFDYEAINKCQYKITINTSKTA